MKDIPGTKYITQNTSGTYRIQKWINGKSVNYGSYSTLEDAIKWRDYFQNRKWDECYDERSKHSTACPKYISYIKKTNLYIIQKTINGKREYFGHFKNYSDAIEEVELLKKYDWDLQTVCDLA